MSDVTRLGRYKILKELGRGGMGVVYMAEDDMLGRTVALKTVTQKSSVALTERLMREARLSAKLDHPCVIRLYDIGEQSGITFLVLEFVEGRTLSELLHTVGAMRTSDALRIFRDVAAGVAHAHDLGIVHRDLKPDNVMVTNDGRAKVMDFGLAWQNDQARLTHTGAVMGTLAYFSPEQAKGGVADARSDLYSLGAILFELLTGRMVFDAKSPAEMVMHHLQTPPPSVRDLRPTVPAELDAVVQRCLQKNPSDRFDSVRQLLDVLDGIKDMPSLAPRPLSNAPPPSGLGAPLLMEVSMPPTPGHKMPPSVAPMSHTAYGAPGSQMPMPQSMPVNSQWGLFQRKMANLENAFLVSSVDAVPIEPAPAPAPPPPAPVPVPAPAPVRTRPEEARPSDDTARQLQDAIRQHPREGRSYRHLARLYNQQGKLTEAVAVCRNGLAQVPDDALLRTIMGDVLVRQGALSDAMTAYQEAVRKKPELLDAWRALGRLCASRDQVIEALRAYEAVIKLDPKDLEAARALPGLYLKQANPARAEQCARAALKLLPHETAMKVDLARALEGQQKTLQAAQLLHEAARQDPKSVLPWLALVKLHVRQGANEAAATVLEEGLFHHPHASTLLWQQGEFQERDGQPDRALDSFEKALWAVPAVAEAVQETASLTSQAALEQAYKQDPADRRVIVALGRLYLRQRQAPEANTLLNRALDQMPGELIIHFLVGQARRILGDREASFRSYRRAWERCRLG